MSATRLFLIDAHALCYRSYYAIKGLSTGSGQPTNAVYGFVNTLRKIMKAYDPQYLAVCFDVKGKTHRQKKYADYKIQRPPMPEDLISQVELIRRIVKAYRIPILEKEGYEADDMIGAVVRTFSHPGLEQIIVSDDKDMYQLLDEQVKILSIRKDRIFDEQAVAKDLGFAPRMMADFIGLAGDQVDNIPGVPGIGAVSARKLINAFGPLEDIYQRVTEVKPQRLQDKLVEHQEQAFLSKELALFASEIELKADLASLAVQEPDSEALYRLFTELEFTRFAQDMAVDRSEEKAVPSRLVTAETDLQALREQVFKSQKLSFVFEQAAPFGDGLFDISGVHISCGREVFYVESAQLAQLRDIFQSKDIIKLTYNMKDGVKSLAVLECGLGGAVFDIMLAGYLLSPVRSGFDLKALAWQYLKDVVPDPVQPSGQADLVFRLHLLLEKDLTDRKLLPLLFDIEQPLARVLAKMEEAGVALDEKHLQDLSRDCDKKIAKLHDKLIKSAGGEFNLNSPKQLSQILFEKLKLPVLKKTKTGFSTNEEVLTRLADLHPLPAMILEYRQIAKLKSTYIDALPKMVNARTGRIHANFNQTGTETGRLSSNNPNLQNIPIRTEMGREIRRAFVPEKKNVIVSVDYSQIELRILAHLSGDDALQEAFQKDEDIHRHTAARIYDVEEAGVTKDMRNAAKRVNFGIIYGISAFGLAKDLKVMQPEAQAFINRYFHRYPKVKDFMDQQVKFCEEQGYVLTLLNRRRYIPEISSENMGLRQFAQRQAFNTPVQGSAADLIKLAMIRVDEQLAARGLGSQMIITVHDELVFDTPGAEKEDLISMVREVMEQAMELSVPIKVTVKAGPNWLDMETILS